MVFLRDEDWGQYCLKSSLSLNAVQDAPLEGFVVDTKVYEKIRLIQRYLDRLDKCAEIIYVKLRESKCMNDPVQLGTEWLENVSAEKELGFLGTTR